jgi:archaemetzincin
MIAHRFGTATWVGLATVLVTAAWGAWSAAAPPVMSGPASRPSGARSATRSSAASAPAAGKPARPLTAAEMKALREKLRPLASKMDKPGPSDWLANHKEAGQTFEQYLGIEQKVTVAGSRRILYIQPLGDFTAGQRKVVDLSAEFVGLFYGCQVKVQPDVPLSVIPAKARREHPGSAGGQILTTYVMDGVLKPTLPADAVARIAFTAKDLWAGEGWNFVFGQASLHDRVGVWSIHRNGDADGNEAEVRLCLRRTIRTASHEIGHMFSIEHCIAYQCGMCGSNNLAEADAGPLEFCPECVAKVWWACRYDPATRFRKLADFCTRQGLKSEAEFYEKSLKAIDAN